MKCYTCDRKLKVLEEVSNQCKCGNVYCNRHISVLLPNDVEEKGHRCAWNYLQEHKLKLEKNIVVLKKKSGLETI